MTPQPDANADRLLEVAQAARRLGMSFEYVRRQIRAGKLPALRFGRLYRIKSADLDAYIEARRLDATGAH